MEYASKRVHRGASLAVIAAEFPVAATIALAPQRQVAVAALSDVAMACRFWRAVPGAAEGAYLIDSQSVALGAVRKKGTAN